MSFLRLPTIGNINRAGKKRQYDPKLLSLAYEEVTVKGASVHKAAKLYGIPDSTLRDRFRGPFQPAPEGEHFNVYSGPFTTLTLEEENDLAKHAMYMASIGYGYSRSEFINLATDYAISLRKKKPTDPQFAQSWYDGFKNRHPEIVLSKPQKLALVRAKNTSPEVLDRYFASLTKVMTDKNLLNKPENIWNIDETGLLMEHSPSNIVCGKGTTPQAVTSNRGLTVTIIAAGNAVGTCIPPFYVFPGKRMIDSLLDGACPGAAYTVSETGWSNSVVFREYLDRHFMKHVPSNGSPHLLLFDGHKSHVNLTLKEWGEAHDLIFFVIPPHTSHVTQPLDVGCFGPLKRIYYSECQSFMRKTPGIHINRLNVAAISSTAYNKAMTPANLVSAFKKSGIFPVERKKIDLVKTMPSTIYKNDETTSDKDNISKELDKTKECFLEKKKITHVPAPEKKRTYPPSLQGNMMSPSNQHLLSRPVLKECHQKKTTKKQKEETKSRQKSVKPLMTSSPTQGPSGLNAHVSRSGIPIDSDTLSLSSLSEEHDESELCVVCKKFTPDTFTNAYTVEFLTWGQCDSCDGWVHLKHCTPVRVLRRGATFLCPLCDRET